MASRAKIVFFPKSGATGFCLDKIQIVEKYSNWKYNTDDFIEDGYIYTDTETSINTINSNYWVKFKAVSGFKIVDCHKTNSSGTSNMGDFIVNSDGTVIVYPWNSGTASIITNYLFMSVEVDTDNKHEVNTKLVNCTSDNLVEYTDGEQVTINLTADTGCLFDIEPVLTMGDTSIKFTVSDDKTTATVTFEITNDVIISATATKYHKVIIDLTNCTCDKTVVKDSDTITVTSNEGYILNSNINVVYNHITHSYSSFKDGQTKCVITIAGTSTDVNISGSAVKKTEKLSSFANIYTVDNDKLTELSKVRFYDVTGSSANKVDYGSFITALYKLPFELDESMIADIGSIQLGNYDTRVETSLLSNYEYIVSMGSITVPEKYNNVYDYKDTICILHLPYCDSMTINTEYIMNHTITINYKIDLYSGKCTVNIISDFTNEVIASKNFEIGSKIPFMQVQNNTTVGTIDTVLDNDVKTPYIEVIRSIPYNVNTIFGNETIDFGTLENYKGYLKVSDVLLNINATNEDKNEIETLLKNGVYINEKFVDFSSEN